MKTFYILPFLLLTLLGKPALAQNTGYGGKRFVLKTNVINGLKTPAFSLELECILTRMVTLSIKGGLYNYSVDQRYHSGEYKTSVNPLYGPSYNMNDDALSGEGRILLRDKAQLSTREVELELRYYFGQNIPAPSGFFTCLGLRYSNMDVKGHYYNSLLQDIGHLDSDYDYYTDPEYYYSFETKNISNVGYRVGGGYQKIWKGLIAYGFKLTFDQTFFNVTNQGNEKVLSGVAKSYGSELVTFSNLRNVMSSSNNILFSSSRKHSTVTDMSIGLSLSVQVGIVF
jgi:hypothetical protein